MSNQLAGSDEGWTTVSFKVRPDELADFDTTVENSDHDNRSEALRELVRENADESKERVWLPGREDLREHYRACLDVANDSLVINVRERVNPRVVMDVGGWSSFSAIEPYLNAPTPEVINEEFEKAELT